VRRKLLSVFLSRKGFAKSIRQLYFFFFGQEFVFKLVYT
jgi:hypothetical protein